VILEKRAKTESLGCKLWDSLTFESWLHFASIFYRSVEYLTYYNFFIHTFTSFSLMLVLWLCEYKCPYPWLGFVSHSINTKLLMVFSVEFRIVFLSLQPEQHEFRTCLQLVFICLHIAATISFPTHSVTLLFQGFCGILRRWLRVLLRRRG
jgi:hypothetical protein